MKPEVNPKKTRNIMEEVLTLLLLTLSKYSIEISEDPMFLGNKLQRATACHVNR